MESALLFVLSVCVLFVAIVCVLLVGVVAAMLDRSGIGWALTALIATPLMAILALIALGPKTRAGH